MESSEVNVEGEYMSQTKMEEEGYSEPLWLFNDVHYILSYLVL